MVALAPLRALPPADLPARQEQQEQQLQLLGALSYAEPEDCCCLALVQHGPSGQKLAARVVSQSGVEVRQQQQQVVRTRKVSALLEPCLFVPPVACTIRGWSAGTSTDGLPLKLAGEVLAASAEVSLQLMMATGAPFTHEAAAFLAACVVLGLDHVHRCGVLHRSLAPDGVVLTAEGYALLADMQFARPNEGRAYTTCGTPEYMAPEMVDSIGELRLRCLRRIGGGLQWAW
jgi:hypothetical protein